MSINMSLDELAKAHTPPKRESRPNNYYPFYRMNDGEQCVVRFLPDANETNPFGFTVEKLTHNLTINGQRRTVPCLKMYEEDCPVCKVSSDYYKAEDKDNGKKYWRNKNHLAQVLVLENPITFTEDDGGDPVGKVKLLNIGYQLYNIINDAFASGDLDDIPFSYENGTDFVIKKTKQGDHSAYTLSKFSRRSSAMSAEEIEVAEAGLVDLITVLPNNPGLETVEGLLQADLSNTKYEDGSNSGDRQAPSQSNDTPPAQTPVGESSEEVDEETDAILAKIAARRKEKTAE